MQYLDLDRGWEFRRGFADSPGALKETPSVTVDLPHDAMIGMPVSADAPAGYDSGYYPGVMCNYTKYVAVPEAWKGDRVGLKFGGVMMHAAVSVNGCKAGEHHYGYSPFFLDITDLVAFGQENRITVRTDTGVQSSSRWYSGCGLFRGVRLCRAPGVHIRDDGIFVCTKEVADDTAYLGAEIEIRNATPENRLAEVTLQMLDEADGRPAASVSGTVQINPSADETARFAFTLNAPKLWDTDRPALYRVEVTVRDLGVFGTRFIAEKNRPADTASRLFGIRTVTADAVRGLRVNGRPVKLKGGCVHHDNGLLGAVSLYGSEERKLRKLKEIGFNAIRTAHNPPSEALLEACDRVGMYVFDEAFDAWGMAKRPGDFSTHFESCWEKELTAFVRRDRIHPSVIIWSTGNEIPERGGLNNGYTLAGKLASAVRALDPTRPVSNGICSFWCGLDDCLAQAQDATQNAQNSAAAYSWDGMTAPFANGLDIVGYNYMEDLYENSHRLYPHRVILGSENFPKEIGFRWPYVESLPYVIGDFTWTAWDYIGEAGIGKSLFVGPDDPLIGKGSWAVMPPVTSPYPWRLANDADFDITGRLRPQGAYRSIVWGSGKTFLYAQHPSHAGQTEVISPWGFTDVVKSWNFAGYEGRPVCLTVFSDADEVALYLNGREVDRKPVCMDRPLPYSVCFRTVYEPGTVEAVSFRNGAETGRDMLETAGAPAVLTVTPERSRLKADGHDVAYLNIEVRDGNGRPVPDAALRLTASAEGAGYLAGFGTGDPVTEEDYTDGETVTFCGRATAVIRSVYDPGRIVFTVAAEDAALTASAELISE